MKKVTLLIISIVMALVTQSCGGSTEATPEKIDPVVATVAAMEKEATAQAQAAISTLEPPTQVDQPTMAPATEAPTTPTRYIVGDIVKVGDIQLVINEVKEIPATQFFKPAEGNKFIIIDITMENIGSSDHAASSIIEFTLKDDTGQEYSESFTAEAASGGKSPNGTIVPGDKLRGQIGYEIPITAKGFVLTYSNGFFDAVRAQFDLGF